DLDSAISRARDKLDRERIMLEKARLLASQVSNANVKANAQGMVREAEQRVSYLEAEFRRLSQKRDDKNSIKSGTVSAAPPWLATVTCAGAATDHLPPRATAALHV
ncbi:hypothetical protein IWQ57_006581, partial [Coemansia nantahalensis]